MKKRLLSLLLAALLLLALAPAASADSAFGTEQEVLDFFAQQKKAGTEDFEFTCEKALFDRLMADGASRLSILEVKGGIGDARVRYSETSCLIRLSRVEYCDDPWAECATERDARLAVMGLLEQEAPRFTLLCSPSLAQNLAHSGNLKNFAAQAGFQSVRFSYYTSGVIRAEGGEPITMDWATAENAAQFDAAIEAFADKGQDEFLIVFDPAYFEKLLEDREQLDILHATSMLDRYSYFSGTAPATLKYSRVSYTPNPSLVCRSEEDVVAAIARMGALGVTDFRLYIVGDELRALLMDTPLAYLHGLEAQGGMAWGDISHSDNTIYYTNAHIVSDATALSTVEETLRYMEERAAAGEREITLFCAPELFELLMGKLGSFTLLQDGMDPIYDLVVRAGIFDYELSANRSSGAVSIVINAYYPGQEILRAVENGTEDDLPPRLQETLEAARRMADASLSPDPLETARKIHDALCESVVYVDDEETEEDDTAVGALLNGEANCDGYSDAFYLVGTLAGLEVRCQHGDSLVKGFGVVSFGDSVTHMWNLLQIDDTWRMVDVTWDDGEDGPDYTWFNLGRDRAARTHLWNEETSLPLLEETDLRFRPENEFSVTSPEEMEAAVDAALAAGWPSFSLIYDDESYADSDAALSRIRQGVSGSFRYSWGPEMRRLQIQLD